MKWVKVENWSYNISCILRLVYVTNISYVITNSLLYKSWIWPRDLGLGICNIAEWMQHTMDKLILARFLKNVKLKPTKQSWYYERWQEILFIAKIVVHLFLRLPWINEWCRKFPLLLGIHYLQNSCDVWNSYLFFVVFALEGK